MQDATLAPSPRAHPYLVWDLETSGLDPLTDRILEIGCKVVYPHGGELKASWLLNHPGFRVTPDTVKLTGITDALLQAEGQDPETVLRLFLDTLEKFDAEHVTHNGVRFDLPFLAHALAPFFGWSDVQRYRCEDWLAARTTDTAAIFKGQKLGLARHPGETGGDYAARVLEVRVKGLRYNIPTCCEALGIDTTGATFHRALGDVMLTDEIFRALVASGAA